MRTRGIKKDYFFCARRVIYVSIYLNVSIAKINYETSRFVRFDIRYRSSSGTEYFFLTEICPRLRKSSPNPVADTSINANSNRKGGGGEKPKEIHEYRYHPIQLCITSRTDTRVVNNVVNAVRFVSSR